METLKRFPDQFIDGIITSPPYNINTERSDCYYNNGYSDLDRLSESDYLNVRLEVSKINEKTNQKFYKNYTNFIEAKNNDGFKCKLKASYSQELVDKLIFIYFKHGSLIYDPFIGIGTTALSCINNNCYYVGSELDGEHFEIATQRIKLWKK